MAFVTEKSVITIKLFQLEHVKQEMRNLCVLRMIHGFTESMPLLLIQVLPIDNTASVNTADTLLESQSYLPLMDLLTLLTPKQNVVI
jgi:hypothetical protein